MGLGNTLGALPVANGGTGTTTFTSGNVLVGAGTGAITTIAKTNANTANTLVQRDASGNFSAGTITASLTGHASLDLPLTGGTMTGQIKTSFKSSIAVGSYQPTATTIPDLLTELRYSSGCMGSISLSTAYTATAGGTIATG